VRFNGQILQGDEVPCVTLGDLSELEAEEAELDENIKRKDLTWQERANATARLIALRQKQTAASGALPPTVASIALEVKGSAEGRHYVDTRREIIVAQHLHDPEVKAAKSVEDAFKVLKRKEEAARHVALAATVGATFTADLHQVHNVDSFDWLEAYAGELFDVVCTDPIYGIGADQFGDSGGIAAGGAHKYKDDYATWKRDMPRFARLAAKLTKPQAHLYAFCDVDRFVEFKAIMEDEGWTCFRTPIIWNKPAGSRLPWIDFGPQRKYELVLYANKGRKPVTRIFPDLVSYPADTNLGWAAQKPVDMFIDLLKRSVAPGDRILDPFAGSGPVFPAAHSLKCTAIGLEGDAIAYGICLRRLQALKAQGELPLQPEPVDTKELLKGLAS
jgi:DNA modification methylase